MSHSSSVRRRLLNRNPILWLASRDRWVIVHIWLWMVIPVAGWGWLAWFSWSFQGLNIAVVLAGAAALSWLTSFAVLAPSYACRQLVADRLSGALEMILSTPLTVKEISRGVWLSVARRFLAPLLVVMTLSVLLMITGYVTFGFGGMLDPEDRPLWLFLWLQGIILLPLCLVTLCWVAMRQPCHAT